MNKLDREGLVRALAEHEWEKDRFGHFKKVVYPRNRRTGELVRKVYRVKMQANSIRVEVQMKVDDRTEWFRVGGTFYKNLCQRENGDIIVGSLVLRKGPII